MKKLLIAATLCIASSFAYAADIVEEAVANPDFSTLVTALRAAGLVGTLQGEGPFTVFAPTNAAFAKLPPASLHALLKDRVKLTKILTYHVVSGKVMAADVKPGAVKTVQGSSFNITVNNGVVKVDNATVIKTDVPATNGVIHAIDTVIMPK